jgi:iron-sulfur cluster repair protein YtfE (RIC family)
VPDRPSYAARVKPTKLLNDDGTASMATMIMTSHHGFRRDLARFQRAITNVDTTRIDALREEWKSFHEALHHHHTVEDTAMFPGMKTEHPQVAPAIDHLFDQHHRIDPLLARGDHAFAALPDTHELHDVLEALRVLLDAHLDMEEAVVIPMLRTAKEFPMPPDDGATAMYADGFAWSTQGLAPEVCEKLNEMLPPALVEKLPAAIEKFAERCTRVWGTYTVGATTTSAPDDATT